MFSQENHLKLNNVLESFYTNSEYKCNFDFLKIQDENIFKFFTTKFCTLDWFF